MPSFAAHGDDWSGACRSRDLASPIDLDGPALTSPATTDPFQYFYAPVALLDLFNNGRALEVSTPGVGGMFHPAGGWHNLREVRLRADAEHTVAGHRAALEVQLVHEQPETGGLLIASVLFDPPAGTTTNRSEDVLVNYTAPVDAGASSFLEPLVEHRPPRLEERTAANVSAGQFDLNTLVDGTFVEYAGGDTLPPCQNALWMVRTAPMEAGAGQLARLGQAARDLSAGFGNYRALMPLNQRLFVVRRGQREESPVGAAPAPGVAAPVDETVFKGEQVAQDALTIEKYVSDYARDLDHRLQAGAVARLADLVPTTNPPAAPPPTAAPGMSKVMRDLSTAARNLDGLVKSALKSPEVTLPARKAAQELAGSYTREQLVVAANQTAASQPAPELMRAALRGLAR